MARIIWAPRALRNLDELLIHIEKDAPFAAQRFGQKVIAKVDLLAGHPLLGGYVPEDEHRIYRQLRQGNYRVIYRAEPDTVYIVAIHHASRLLDVDDLAS